MSETVFDRRARNSGRRASGKQRRAVHAADAYEREQSGDCDHNHASCRFAAGSLYCVVDDCANPHHRANVGGAT